MSCHVTTLPRNSNHRSISATTASASSRLTTQSCQLQPTHIAPFLTEMGETWNAAPLTSVLMANVECVIFQLLCQNSTCVVASKPSYSPASTTRTVVYSAAAFGRATVNSAG